MSLKKRIDRLRVWIRDRLSGGCRMLSQGRECTCVLCDFDRICEVAKEAKEVAKEAKEEAQAVPFSQERNFEILQNCFWCGLNRKEQHDVLSKLGVFPVNTTNTAMTLELLAMNILLVGGKAGDLWHEVMLRLPENKRIPNPFN